jgi:putative spermidine/putrescine transport system substrate-binding protein
MEKLLLKLTAMLFIFSIALFAFAGGKEEVEKEFEFGVGPIELEKLAELAAEEGDLIVSYGLPDNWAGWKELFEVFGQKYNKPKHFDTDLSSGEEIAKMKAEKGNPQADIGDIGITWGPKAIEEGVPAQYKHKYWNEIPDAYKDPNGYWCAWYKGTYMFMVNERAVPKVPKSWADLLDPMYKGKVTIGDPRTAAMYWAGFWAANLAMGGSETNIDPGIEFFKKLREMGNMKLINPSKPAFGKGEVPIYLGWDFLFLNWAKEFREEANMQISTIIPEDTSVSLPYVYMINSVAPRPATARLWVEFVLSDEGQIINAKYYASPIRESVELPPEVKALYPPEEAYKSVKIIDWIKAEKIKDEFINRWSHEVLGE